MAKTRLSPSDFANVFSDREMLHPEHASIVGLAATGVVRRWRSDRKLLLRTIRLTMGTTGSANTTSAVANINGTPVVGLQADVANTDADGFEAVDVPTDETIIESGDLVDLELTAIATANADATIRLYLVEVFD